MSFDDALGQPLGINPTEYVNDLIQNQAGGVRTPGVGVNPTVEVNRLLRKGLQGQRPPEPPPVPEVPATPQAPSLPAMPGERSFREYGEPIEAPSSTPGEGARPAGQSTPPTGQQGKGQFSEYGEPVDMGGGDQMPGVIQAAGQGLKRGGQELSQTAEMLGRSRPELTAENDPEYAMTAGAIGAPIPTQAMAPRPELPPPMQPLPAETSAAAKPVTWGDFLHPMSMLPKLAYQTGHGAAQIAGGAAAGAVGTAAGGPVAGAGAAGVVAGGITIAQQLGPYYMEALKETGDPDKAYDIAIRKADLDGVISAAAFAAFGVAPFNGFLKNLLFQSFVAQPTVAVGGKVAKNVQEGKPFDEDTGEEVPGAIAGTLIPGAAMHAALHGRGPNRTAEPGKPVEENLSNNPEEFFKRGGRTESWPPEPPPKTGGPGAAETPPRTPRETIEEFIRQRDAASAAGRSKEFQDAARAAEDKAKAGGRDIMEALDEFLKQNAKPENPHTAQAKNEENLANQGYRRKQEEEQAARAKAAADAESGQAPSENGQKQPESGEKPVAPKPPEGEAGAPAAPVGDVMGFLHEAAASDAMEGIPGQRPPGGPGEAQGTGRSAIELKIGADVAHAAGQASQDHTHEQGEAQTYRMGKATWEGLPISFEAPAGGVRRGINPKTGERWEAKVGSATGFIEGTKGGDGQELDINFGPHPDSPTVFVINELDRKTGEYKQTKSFAGFKTARAATNAYLGSGGKTREQIASIVPMDRAQFKDWVETADHTKPAEAKKEEPAAAEGTPAGSPPQGVNGAEGVAPEAANDKAEVDVGSPSGTRHNQEEISAPEAREIHQHRQAVEDAIRARGEDPDALRPVDLHRAAEIMAHEGYGPDDAFQIAIARAFLEDGHLTPEQVQEFYGKNAEAILHPKPASERGVRAEASGAATGGPAAETGKAQAVEGAAERPPGGGEAGQGPGQAGEAVAGGTADIPPGQESHPGGGTTDQVSHPEHAVGGAPGGTEAAERPVEEGNTRPAKTAKRPVKPHSLLEFIAAQGGLKPTPELRDLELPKSVTVPGLGWRSLIRRAGHDLDTMRRKAVEAGYVWDEPDRVGGGVSTPNDLLEKIAAEAKGHRQMAVGEEEHKTARQREIEQETGENRAEALRRQRKRLEDYVKSTGAPIDAFHAEDIHDAIEMMEDRGLPPERAIEAAWMRNNAREDLAPGEEFIDNYGEEPFHDEVHGATAPGHGEEAEPAGGRRPEGEEGRPAEPGPRGIGVGAAGGQERERPEPEGGGERTSGEVWWDHELTRAGRRELILRAFGERDIIVPDRIRWHYLKPEEQEKLLALRDTEATPTAGEPAGRVDEHDWSEFPEGKRPTEFMGRPVPENAVPWKEAKAGDTLVSGATVVERKIDRKARAIELAKEVGGHLSLDGPKHWAVLKNPAKSEATPAGEQHVLPGAEKIGEGEQAQIKSDKPLKPKVAQKPADEGLFGEHGQTDLVDMAKTPEPKEFTGAELDKIRDRLSDLGAARARGVDYKIVESSKPGNFYFTRIENGIRIEKGGAIHQGGWSRDKAVREAMNDINHVVNTPPSDDSKRVKREYEQLKARGLSDQAIKEDFTGLYDAAKALGLTEAEAPPVAAAPETEKPTKVDVPPGFEVDPAVEVPAKDVHLHAGKFSAVARRLKPWSVDRGYADTKEEAQRDALRRVGAYAEAEKPTENADFIRGQENAKKDGPESTRRRGGSQDERDGYDATKAKAFADLHRPEKTLSELKAEAALAEANAKIKPMEAAEPPASADVALARGLVELLKAGKPISNKALQEAATAAYGGKLAEGKFDRKDAHDALELAVNMLVKDDPLLHLGKIPTWEGTAERLERVLGRLPTQTVRSEEQVSFQQFSTPPTYSMAAAYVANLRDGDVVLEPSAGTGSLVAAAERPGVKIVANEVSPRRAELLRALIGKDGKVYTENAEQIDNILKEQPTVVVMNPPFSRTAGRMGDKKVIGAGAAHLEAALNLLAPGGRLVAILGRGMAPDANKFKDWWQKIGAKNTVRANIGVDGDVYKKYGTHFGTRLVVIDKVPPTGEKPVVVEVKTVADLMRALEPIRETRPEQRSSEQGRPALVAGGEGGRSELSTSPESGVLGPGTRGAGGVAGAGPSGGRGAAGPTPGVEAGERPGVVAGEPGGAKPAGTAGKPSAGDQGGGKPTEGGGGNPERDLQPGAVGKPGAAAGSERIELEHAAPGSQTASAITDSLYESYEPKKVKIKGAKKHPGPLVESAAMASVDAPDPTYRPTLPKDVVEKGLLSIAQIEAVVYAGQAHQSMLPAAEGLGAPRRGFFIGDGTGVGKGREIAGVILDNWQQGRHKAVWVSEKKKLLNDAKRDWDGLGQDKKLLFDVGKTKTGEPVKAERGIAFVTYDTLKGGMSEQAAVSRGGLPKGTEVRDTTTGQIWTITGKATKDNYHPVKNKTTGETGNIPRPLLEPVGEIAEVKSRVDQIVDWFGADFDGVIAFDESHNMGNATAEKGSRGQKDAALKALAGLELQNRLPNARVVYVSATGATEVSNLAYAERLGLWGRGTAFASRQNFVGEVEGGGVAAMELIARDMKNMGLYMARNLSYDGVEYSRLQHTLDKAQREIYDTAAEAWQIVLKNIEAALQLTGGDKNSRAKSAAKSAFWGAHQRFFNQIITSLQMPTVIKAVEKDLDAGRQVVLQLTNTNEASQERAAAKAETAEDIEDLDITPRDQIIQLIEHSFPTQEYEEYVDEAGNEGVRPVFDSDGNPVQNKEAVAMREALIDRLASLRVPQGPLDLVLDHFGHEVAAEVTGRGRRFILKTDDKTGQRKRVEESRPASANQSEIDKFQAGKKKVLVFSEAGGTGASYHADNGSDSKNARRAHYLVQAGWRADKAVQGFGRTHRTNQASAPIFHLVSTDLDGQKRFISSIARRLGQLGALTKGQRQAGDQGIFSARDNLESREAKTALQQFFAELYNGRIEGINIDEFERQTGLMLRQRDKDGGILGLRTDLPPITQFLNRLLSMKIEQQNGTFRAFSEILDNVIEARQAAGLLDVGLETVRAEKIAKQSEQTVHVDKESGAETKYVKLALSDKFIPTPFKNIANNNLWPVKRWVTSPTGKIYAATEAPDKTEGDTGRIVPQFRLMSPVSGTRYEPRETVTKGPKWGNVDPGKAREMWEAETAAAPEFITRDMHLITGAVLPVWDRLKGSSRIVRLNTDEGERMIGRVVPSRDLAATLKALGAEAKGEKVTPGKLFDTIMAGGRAEMANGWSLSRRTVAGEHRIEVKGPRTYSEGQEIKQDGVFTERIAYETRYFVPTDPAVGKKVLERLTQYRPVTVLEGGESPEAGVAESTIPFGADNGISQEALTGVFEYIPLKPPVIKSNHGAAAQKLVLEKGHETGIEYLLAFDAKGAVIQYASGTKNSVGFSDEFNKLVADPAQDIVLHHNHPSNAVLSRRDIAMMGAPGLKVVWAHGHDGSVSRAELTPRMRAVVLQGTPAQAKDGLWKMVSAIADALYSPIYAVVQRGNLSPPEAGRLHNHLINTVMHRAGVIDYQSNIDADADVAEFGLERHISDIASKLRASFPNDSKPGTDRRAGRVRYVGDVGAVFGDPQTVAGRNGPQIADDRGGRADDRKKAPPVAPSLRDSFADEVESFGTPLAKQHRAQVEERLRDLATHLMGPRANVEFPQTIPMDKPPPGYGAARGNARSFAGQYFPTLDLVKIALGDPKWRDPQSNVNHEAFHWVEDHFATPQEMAVAVREDASLRRYVEQYLQVQKGDLAPMSSFEIRAYAFMRYMDEQHRGMPSYGVHAGLRRFFQRGTDFFKRVRNSLADLGFTTTNDFFRDIAAGEVAKRPDRMLDQGKPSRVLAQAHTDDPEEQERRAVAMAIPIPPKVASIFERFMEGTQDLSRRVQQLEDDIRARNAGVLPDSRAFYEMKRLFPGKRDIRVREFNAAHMKPLFAHLEANKISGKEFGQYLYARHAIERNMKLGPLYPPTHQFHIAMSDPSVVGASGMSANEARAIITKAMTAPNRQGYIDGTARVHRIIDFINSAMVAGELETQGTIDAWNAMYREYVPLSGFEDEDEDPGARTGGNFDVRGKEVKQAFGRGSKAANPLENLLNLAYRTIERAEKNRYKRSLADTISGLSQADRDDIGVKINRGELKKQINRTTGRIEMVPDPGARFSPHSVHFKVMGQSWFIHFEDRTLAESINRMSPDQMVPFLQGALNMQNHLKALWTHYSPDFLIRHFLFRYPIEAAMNAIETEGVKGAAKIWWKGQPLGSEAVRAIFRNSGTEPIDRYWTEMKAQGGAMMFRNMRDMDLMREDLKLGLRALRGGPAKTVLDKLAAAREAMDHVTNTLDNALRLSVYASARDRGISPQKAAVMAREATVDFQLKGRYANWIGLWFPFGNVAIQTSARMLKAVHRSKVMKQVFVGTMAAGFALSAWNYLGGGVDTDGVPFFEKVPEWERRMNFIIMNPFNSDSEGRPDVIKIPMPYNWAMPLSIGYASGGVVFGNLGVAGALGQALHSTFEALTPAGAMENHTDLLSPELLRPIAHLATNRDAFNRPIHAEEKFGNQKQPNSYSGKKDFRGIERTGYGWKYIAESLNDLTGGHPHKQGWIDFYPEDIREVFDYAFGTQKRLIQNVIKTGQDAAEGKHDPTHVPLERVFHGVDYDAADRALGYERHDLSTHPWKR